jgi:integrase
VAYIEKRANNQWQARVRRKGFPPETKTFNSRADAEEWATHLESEMKRGVYVSRAEAERTLLSEALERYEREVSRFKKGHEEEKYRIGKWKRHKLAKSSLAALRPTDFAKYRDERLAEGAATSTVRLELAVISHLCTVATKEWGIPIINPIANIRLPKVQNTRERRLIADEETWLLEAVTSPAGTRSNNWIKPIVIIALETAMRLGEILSLRWEHVDLKSQVAHLPATKNGTTRDVPLSTKAVTTLSNLPRSIDGQVFPTTQSALKQSWQRAVERARKAYVAECEKNQSTVHEKFLTNLHFHDLRHEATSRLAEKLALHELMKVTGHKDTRMLARYYHPRAENLAKKLG